jgi:hypothetical protein
LERFVGFVERADQQPARDEPRVQARRLRVFVERAAQFGEVLLAQRTFRLRQAAIERRSVRRDRGTQHVLDLQIVFLDPFLAMRRIREASIGNDVGVRRSA